MDKIEQAGNSGGIDSLDDAWLSLINSGSFYVGPSPEKPAPAPLDRDGELDNERGTGEAAPAPEPLVPASAIPKEPPVPVNFGDTRAEQKVLSLKDETGGLAEQAAGEDKTSDIESFDEPVSYEKQKLELVSVLENGNAAGILGPNNVDVAVSPEEYGRALENIKNGGIEIGDWKNIIGNVQRAVDEKPVEEIFEDIKSDEAELDALGRLSGFGAGKNKEGVLAGDIEHLVTAFPTAVAFEVRKDMFMNTAKKDLTEEEIKKTNDTIDRLACKIYGEQYKYWAAAKSLMEEAKNADF